MVPKRDGTFSIKRAFGHARAQSATARVVGLWMGHKTVQAAWGIVESALELKLDTWLRRIRRTCLWGIQSNEQPVMCGRAQLGKAGAQLTVQIVVTSLASAESMEIGEPRVE